MIVPERPKESVPPSGSGEKSSQDASFDHKLAQVREVLRDCAEELRQFKSDAFEKCSVETRELHRYVLTYAVTDIGETYDEQLLFLRTLEQLQLNHLLILRALTQQPAKALGVMSSPAQTLSKRLSPMDTSLISELVSQLSDFRIINLPNMETVMTGQGAEDLQHSITPYGHRLLQFILQP